MADISLSASGAHWPYDGEKIRWITNELLLRYRICGARAATLSVAVHVFDADADADGDVMSMPMSITLALLLKGRSNLLYSLENTKGCSLFTKIMFVL